MAGFTHTLEVRRAWWFTPLCRTFALLIWFGVPISADWAVRILKKAFTFSARPT